MKIDKDEAVYWLDPDLRTSRTYLKLPLTHVGYEVTEAEEIVAAYDYNPWWYFTACDPDLGFAFAAAWEQERPATKRSETGSEDPYSLFSEIVRMGIDEGAGWTNQLLADDLLNRWYQLLNDMFEAGQIAGRSPAVEQRAWTEESL